MDMVERVARAMAKHKWLDIGGPDSTSLGAPAWTYEIKLARLAIAAMREPTEEMLADHAGKNYSFLLGGEGQYISDEDVVLNWQELIDAALTSSGKG